MDNYITKRTDSSLEIVTVKSTRFMISTKGQTILVTMSAYLGKTATYEFIISLNCRRPNQSEIRQL